MLHVFKKNLESGDGGITTFLNHYSYAVARRSKLDYSKFDRVHCDGIFLCLALRVLGIQMQRFSFDMTSLAPVVFDDACQNKRRIFLIGGAPGVVEEAADHILHAYPSLELAGTRHGFFSSADERSEVIQTIVEENPDVVVAGMGTPFQDEFLLLLREAGWWGDGYTCGGFFHQTAKTGLKYYPNILHRLHLRWLFRIADEPRLIRRYTIDVLVFMYYFIIDGFAYLRHRKH